MSYISGWLVLVGLALLVWLVAYAVRQSPKRLRPAGPSVQTVQPKSHDGGHGSEHSTPFVKAVKGLVIALLVLLVIWYAIPLLGGVVDTFNHVVFGDRIVRPFTVMTGPRASIGTTTVRYTNDMPCHPWDRARHVCTLTGTTDIVQAAGLPSGLTFCMTPGPDPATADPKDLRWKSIRAILDSGDRIDFDPDHPLTNLAGYELTPMHRLPVTYWFSDSPSCT